MSQISEVNEHILTAIKKDDPFYQALWGNEEFTPETIITKPNDFNCGGIANSLEYFYAFIREITGASLEDLPDPYIDIVVYFFVGLKRQSGEPDSGLIRRMESLIIREGEWRSERFGTPWDILNVLNYYVDRQFLFYVPNAVLTDILINGDFETAIGAEWTFTPSGDRTLEDPFSGDWKVDFAGFTSLSQTVAVTAQTYILNCFANPASDPVGDTDIFNLIIQRASDSWYFNTSTLTWVASDPSNKYTTDKAGYNLGEFFVIADGSYNITITFTKIVDFLLDHVEFGAKEYPAFEIIYVDSGLAGDFASVWETGILPYENASYLDQDYMLASVTTVYSDTYFQSLIDITKASGVKGIFNREVRL